MVIYTLVSFQYIKPRSSPAASPTAKGMPLPMRKVTICFPNGAFSSMPTDSSIILFASLIISSSVWLSLYASSDRIK